ncbi:hypothetical protein M0804_003879 [Polistes exclamans]|nr:hypothetical protein M0804_003879 [Polistes exclamans]
MGIGRGRERVVGWVVTKWSWDIVGVELWTGRLDSKKKKEEEEEEEDLSEFTVDFTNDVVNLANLGWLVGWLVGWI